MESTLLLFGCSNQGDDVVLYAGMLCGVRGEGGAWLCSGFALYRCFLIGLAAGGMGDERSPRDRGSRRTYDAASALTRLGCVGGKELAFPWSRC